jgi:DinB superfamily
LHLPLVADHLRNNVREAEDSMNDLRYPIGKFTYAGPPTPEQKQAFLQQIERAPVRLRTALKGLSQQQLDTPYRPEGWTVRQVAHHVPDSHLNSYIRTKLALTEDEPTIKPYAEDRWARLADTQDTPVEVSLALLDSLHDRWVRLLRSLQPEDWKRTFRHPELGPMTLEKNLALYAWHGRHHVAHITSLRERNGW